MCCVLFHSSFWINPSSKNELSDAAAIAFMETPKISMLQQQQLWLLIAI